MESLTVSNRLNRRPRPFLTAEWRHLLMLNYRVDPAVLAGRVPAGCELEDWNGDALVSVVGFRFLQTRVLGLSVPLHRNFDEVNLRFYVRRKVDSLWRRGVVFVREIVPRRAIALLANGVYSESYVAMPMRSEIDSVTGRLSYAWRRDGVWERVGAEWRGPWSIPNDGDEASFITEHYWGYSRRRAGQTIEYEVEHRPWRVALATDAVLECDITALYGPEFREALAAPPYSALVAEGSPIVVQRGAALF
jgi:uncharacterized protein YqjF (DUF2071 family)